MDEENNFADVIESICKNDNRYKKAAYYFIRQALDYTVREAAKDKTKTRSKHGHHVSGKQLLDGIREFGLNQFGPLTLTVFHHWGVTRCEDFGEIVFNLVDTGVLGKTEDDKQEDFSATYDFHDAFEKPFLPKSSS